jgi:hypothetical protein
MKKSPLVCAVVVCLLPTALLLGQTLIDKRPDPKDMIEIDGAKEPYRIPEWSAWRTAFELLSRGTAAKGHLPSSLTSLVTEADVDLIFRAIDASKKNDAAYDEHRLKQFTRMLDVRTACDKQEPTDQKRSACYRDQGTPIWTEFTEYELAYRQRILDLRNRLLEQLDQRQEVKAALMAWVAERKMGIRVVMLKTEEAHYQRPQ